MASSARIDELRKKFDENPRRYFAPLANEYRKAGDLEQAIFICQEYLPQQPGHMSGHIVYGQALFELGRYDESRLVFETALSLDPENLIALRHLGDIARQTGDSRIARTWYQRVLEADPRNEEIAQIMMTLLSTPALAQSAIDPSLAIDDANRRTDPIGLSPTDLGRGGNSESSSDLTVGPALSELAEQQAPPPLPPTPAWTPRVEVPEHELLDLNDFSIGGVPITEFGLTPSIDEPPPAPEQPVAEASFAESPVAFIADAPMSFIVETPTSFSDDAPAALDDDAPTPISTPAQPASALWDEEAQDAAIEKEEPPFEADPYAVAATTDGFGASFDLGLPDDDGMSPTFVDSNAETRAAFDAFEASPAETPVEPTSAIEFEALFATEPEPAISELPISDFSDSEPLYIAEPDAEPAVFEPTDFELPVPEVVAALYVDEPELPEVVQSFEVDAPLDTDLPELTPDFGGTDGLALPELALEEPPPPELPSEPIASVHEFSGFDTPILAMEAQADPAMDVAFSLPLPGMPDVSDGAAEPDAAPEPEPAPVAEPVAEAAPEPVPAFVTETMAELYLQQGHVEAALDIYQQLVEQRPFDVQLRDRLRVLQERASGRGSEPAARTVLEEPAAPVGPTIREFLAGVASLRPTPLGIPVVMPPSEGGYEFAGAIGLDVQLADLPDSDEASVVVLSQIDLEVLPVDGPASIDDEFGPPRAESSARGTPAAPSETVSGSIDALFSGADASSTDSSAAATLAEAFPLEGSAPTPLHGMPAHKASSELSLDHVFKTGQAPRPSGEIEGFSFDQFFAEDMVDGTAKGAGDAPDASAQTGDDIAQFNNWLNGLKKT